MRVSRAPRHARLGGALRHGATHVHQIGEGAAREAEEAVLASVRLPLFVEQMLDVGQLLRQHALAVKQRASLAQPVRHAPELSGYTPA